MMLFPLSGLNDLTDDGLQELKFQVEMELERRAENECAECGAQLNGVEPDRKCESCGLTETEEGWELAGEVLRP